ncbi:MAG TPA: hypothetical protein VEB18_00735 [Candidatus Paceibacterota bacterium]|nr:hypothetical protein [Candidatus Paceibacterota bacterium]
MKFLLLYMPVLHRGYLDFFEKHKYNDTHCRLLGADALSALGPEAAYVLKKDKAIRAIPDDLTRYFVGALGLFASSKLLDPNDPGHPDEIVAPDEDISVLAAERFFPGVPVTYDGSLRLRYDRKGVARVDPVPESACVTSDEAHLILMRHAEEQTYRSHDWWLQVGALVARDGVPLFTAWNKAVPDPDIVNVLGDPRSLYSRGEGTDDTLVLHAERSLVSQAARAGVSLLGTDAYVTHFPCVPCAEGLKEAGIKRLFFRQGYSRLESASTLEAAGVELIRVV